LAGLNEVSTIHKYGNKISRTNAPRNRYSRMSFLHAPLEVFRELIANPFY
jgi:hypothetical protein